MQLRLRNLPSAASFRPFAAYEEMATSLRNFEYVLVPGLLQTPGYVRAVLATRPNTSEAASDRPPIRLGRFHPPRQRRSAPRLRRPPGPAFPVPGTGAVR